MPVWIWILFTCVIVFLLALDLMIHSRLKKSTLKRSLFECLFWIALALVFNGGLYWFKGFDTALSFFTGYVLEYSLSIDNLFVFVMIFHYFQVPEKSAHKVLFYGILGAIFFRALFIIFGVLLVSKFHFVLYLFALIVLYGSWKMFFHKSEKMDFEKNWMLRLTRRFFPVTKMYVKDHFFVKSKGKYAMTPLVVVLLIVETTDIMFALDSIPAIFAITLDPFIVYTSNIFAILGLRSLYFLLAGSLAPFSYLHYSLAAILAFVGLKMLVHPFFPIPVSISLIVIIGMLCLSILASLIFKTIRKNS